MEKHPEETDCKGTSANQKNDLEPFSPIQVVTTMADHSPEKSEKLLRQSLMQELQGNALLFSP